jgi:hypothetical protein
MTSHDYSHRFRQFVQRRRWRHRWSVAALVGRLVGVLGRGSAELDDRPRLRHLFDS